MATFTPLSTILKRMGRYQTVSTVEEQYKVEDLDSGIREIRRRTLLPWTFTKTTLRVFDDVLFYPVTSDHDELAFFDNKEKTFSLKPREKFTSVREFLENPDLGNDLTEIWHQGTRMLGLRYNKGGLSSILLNNAETASEFTASDDANTIVKDSVFFDEGNAAIRFTITDDAGVASVVNTLPTLSDANYRRKYQFKKVYLSSVPTSMELRLRSSAGNYLSTTVTSQFSGRAFEANAWNLIAQDLNTAAETGVFDETNISSEELVITGASSGVYYIDSSHLREWELLDYYFYSENIVALVGESAASQPFFFNTSEIYSTDSKLLADREWVDLIMYLALEITVADKGDKTLVPLISAKRQEAMSLLEQQYPHMRPQIITNYHKFLTDPMEELYGNH